jgi:hypothetical protein
MGQAAGPSLYAYVGGNPQSYVDPLGLAEQGKIEIAAPNPAIETAYIRLQVLADAAAAKVDATATGDVLSLGFVAR